MIGTNGTGLKRMYGEIQSVRSKGVVDSGYNKDVRFG
jgi:hypothetical protein